MSASIRILTLSKQKSHREVIPTTTLSSASHRLSVAPTPTLLPIVVGLQAVPAAAIALDAAHGVLRDVLHANGAVAHGPL